MLITVTGEVDATNIAQLETYVTKKIVLDEPLVLDLGKLTFMGSAGLHVLLRLNATQREHGTSLHLAAVSGAPARVLYTTGLWDALAIHPNVQRAITSSLNDHTVPHPAHARRR
ncbi:STAS domain-containing protein [Nonomuraea angiospora]|uniref:STAS domain-containing protein n=1 Tax=Nonomuraea angiospora TaxID=46172 RepID=UPI0033CFFDD5